MVWIVGIIASVLVVQSRAAIVAPTHRPKLEMLPRQAQAFIPRIATLLERLRDGNFPIVAVPLGSQSLILVEATAGTHGGLCPHQSALKERKGGV